MPKKKLFGKQDVGCYADSSFGHDHIRDVLADYMDQLREPKLATELRSEPSDDMSEEDDAIDILNENTTKGCSWGMYEGSLCLSADQDWQENPGVCVNPPFTKEHFQVIAEVLRINRPRDARSTQEEVDLWNKIVDDFAAELRRVGRRFDEAKFMNWVNK